MSDTDKPSPPAFPRVIPAWANEYGAVNAAECHHGMSRRDYFAAAALTGFLAGIAHIDRTTVDLWSVIDIAQKAYHYADAMEEASK